jgi:hypothetical protein
MNRNGAAVRVLLASGALVLAACSEAPRLTTPDVPDASLAFQQAEAPDQSTLARQIPGFGGLFLARDGVPTVYLTDVGQRGLAERLLGPYLRGRGLLPAQLRVVPGEYGYQQLSGWFDRVSPEALAVPGAVLVDLDEASNRVRVGVENAAAAASVRGVVARLGVPASAVTVEETEPVVYAATLRDFVRPTQGGLQINFGNFVCTLGFNALHSAGNSFIVNSHCTDKQGGTEGTLYYQPLASVSGSFIGTEADDPTYFRGGVCPRGRRCRYSDSARAAYAAGVSFDLGGIAQTTGANNGSITIAGTFNITAENTSSSFTVGEVVNKIGRTTGWTQGQITSTCVNTNVSGTNITQLCQTFVAAGVGGGDSGSPVFRQTGASSVTLYGILWGGNQSGTSFVFSPLGQVEQELGALTTN